MDKFQLCSDYRPTGHQPEAIAGLVNGVNWGLREQTLLGVTGSGKTFTMANVIAQLNRPTLVLAHNHPSGIAVPSAEDRVTTMRLARALSAVEITLADHVVVAGNDAVSMAQSGWYVPKDYDLYDD